MPGPRRFERSGEAFGSRVLLALMFATPAASETPGNGCSTIATRARARPARASDQPCGERGAERRERGDGRSRAEGGQIEGGLEVVEDDGECDAAAADGVLADAEEDHRLAVEAIPDLDRLAERARLPRVEPLGPERAASLKRERVGVDRRAGGAARRERDLAAIDRRRSRKRGTV